MWDPLYGAGVRPGSRVGVIGIGGLGHLAIQFASKIGMEVVVFSSSESKAQEAFGFGASEFHITSEVENFGSIAKVDALLITANTLPDLNLSVFSQAIQLYPLTFPLDTCRSWHAVRRSSL